MSGGSIKAKGNISFSESVDIEMQVGFMGNVSNQ